MTLWMLYSILAACTGGGGGKTTERDDTGTEDCGTTLEGFADADGDGYGDDALPVEGCAGDPGIATEGGDCDDSDASVRPYAGDTCGDGVDQDCTGADRACGAFEPGDAAVAIACGEDWGIPDSWVNYLGASATVDGTPVRVLERYLGQLGAVQLHEGSYAADDAVVATWTQSVSTSIFLWSDYRTYAGARGDALFASFSGEFGGTPGIRRFDPPWTGDRTEDDADATWESEDVAGLAIGNGVGPEDSDRIVVFVSDSTGLWGTYAVDPLEGGGDLGDAAAAFVDRAWLLPAGDLDGDGVSDFVTLDDSGPERTLGAISGPIEDGEYAASDLESRLWTTETGYSWAPVAVGDVDGDGLGELAMQLQNATGTSTVSRRIYLFHGDAPSGGLESASYLTLTNDDCPITYDAYDFHPYCEAFLFPVAVGDLDADDKADLLAQGAYAEATSSTADIVVVRGGSSGTVDLGGGTADLVRFNSGLGEWFIPGPDEVRPAGGFSQDFDGDGALDLFLPLYGDSAGMEILGFRGPIE